jgi:hypothetical protein
MYLAMGILHKLVSKIAQIHSNEGVFFLFDVNELYKTLSSELLKCITFLQVTLLHLDQVIFSDND